MNAFYKIRPIEDHTWIRAPRDRESTRFSAKWSATERLLRTELEAFSHPVEEAAKVLGLVG